MAKAHTRGKPGITSNRYGEVDQSKRALTKSVVGLLVASTVARTAVAGTATDLADEEDGKRLRQEAWGDPATLVSTIAAGTVAVRSVDETVAAYTQGFKYVESWRGSITKETAELWGAPAMAGRKAALVGPPGFKTGMIRIVEIGDEFQAIDYPSTVGWLALEIMTKSPDDLVGQLKGLPFEHTGGPGDFRTAEGILLYRAAQFTGPSGEALYMTWHVQLDTPELSGPNNVGPLFMQTINAHSYPKCRDFYKDTLAMQTRLELEYPRADLSRRLGLPEDENYNMLAVRAPGYSTIQIDEYPAVAKTRTAATGSFVPGVNMCTFTTDKLDAIKAALVAENIAFRQIESTSVPPFTGRRAIACEGYSGERLEFVEV